MLLGCCLRQAAASADNPVDLLASAGPQQYAIALTAVLEDPQVPHSFFLNRSSLQSAASGGDPPLEDKRQQP